MYEMTLTCPTDVATRETVDFIVPRLPMGARIIEVGCGAGHVALELGRRGFWIDPIDSNKEIVAKARSIGVQAELATWPDFPTSPVDAIAFTRSLHHIRPLGEAIQAACDVLKSDGFLFVEDFAFEEADQLTLRWLVNSIRTFSHSLVSPVPGELLTDLLATKDPLSVWRRSRAGEALNSIAEITKAIRDRMRIIEVDQVPYLYRYLIPVLPSGQEAATCTDVLFEQERRVGEKGMIRLLGRRITASL